MPGTLNFQSIELNHSFLNILRSCLQGSFAASNILSQLQYYDFNPDRLARYQGQLEKVEKLLQRLDQGIVLQEKSSKGTPSSEIKYLQSLLSKVRAELGNSAQKVEQILLRHSLHEHEEDIKFLIAAYARSAYTEEYMIRGISEFAQKFSLVELERQMEPVLQAASEKVDSAHVFFDIFTSPGERPPVFYKGLYEESIFLPGLFRTNIHDLFRLYVNLFGEFTFSSTMIPENQWNDWSTLNISPEEAGYWHAFGISPNESVYWKDANLGYPRTAFFWKHYGFLSTEAPMWHQYGLMPHIARIWSDAGFEPEICAEYVRSGILFPEQIPTDEVEN